jgi:hypothetical protein
LISFIFARMPKSRSRLDSVNDVHVVEMDAIAQFVKQALLGIGMHVGEQEFDTATAALTGSC